MGGAASAFVVLCVLMIVGAPIALSIPDRKQDWTVLAFEAFVVGLVVELVVALALLHRAVVQPAQRSGAHGGRRRRGDTRGPALRWPFA